MKRKMKPSVSRDDFMEECDENSEEDGEPDRDEFVKELNTTS